MNHGENAVFSELDENGETVETEVLILAYNTDTEKAMVAFPTEAGYTDVRNFVPTSKLSAPEVSGEGA